MASRSGPVLAQDIECPSGVEILDPEYVICTLGGDANLNIEMTIEKGCGYVPAHLHAHEDRPLGVLPIDAMFSPVRRVVSRVEPTRVGQRSDYDRLVLIVETNGSIKPDEAVSYAASVLQDQLSVLVGFMDLATGDQQVDNKSTISFNPVLLGSVKDLELSVRSQNCLADLGIKRIGDLVVQTEDGLLGTPNFGRKSLNEIKEVLSQMGLGLCMDVPGWPPENIEDLSKTLLNW
jgi:DNA-directed RNA polymerase subunit alpha